MVPRPAPGSVVCPGHGKVTTNQPQHRECWLQLLPLSRAVTTDPPPTDTGLGAWKRSPAAKPDGDILLPLDGIPQWVGSGLKTNNTLLLARFWYLAYSSVSLCMCILGSRVGGQHNNRGSELQRQGKSQMLGQGAGREFLPPALPPEKPRS